MRMVACIVSLLLAMPALAEPATERYAPGQLQLAQEELAQARDALRAGNLPLAGTLAWQAELDARLAWRMSESAALRAAAATVAQEAQRLVREQAARN